MKKTFRLSESEIRHMITETVQKVLNEVYNDNYVEDAINELTNN